VREFSELGPSFDEPVNTYSAGMRARLGFSTALLTRVDVLLIDEILSVGDARFRRKAGQAMRERLGGEQTVVLVSHAEEQLAGACDRAVVLEAGRLAFVGATDEALAVYREAATGT
jgi:lipopolysaccharide transport system ATP-binding protein